MRADVVGIAVEILKASCGLFQAAQLAQEGCLS